ncbi:hypothetical protein BH23CHL2_BH23CHL2_24130 [soil metagenome]
MTVSTEREYNYATFPSDDDPELFAAFPEHLKPGEPAPDPELLDLDTGDRLSLHEITRQGLTVIELGSLT